MRAAVVKTVAERDHAARVVPRDHGREAARLPGYRTAEQHTTRRIAGAFFQMQVGDHQQALLFPEQRAGEIGDQCDSGDDQRRASDIHSGARGRSSSRISPVPSRSIHRLFDQFLGGFRQQSSEASP